MLYVVFDKKHWQAELDCKWIVAKWHDSGLEASAQLPETFNPCNLKKYSEFWWRALKGELFRHVPILPKHGLLLIENINLRQCSTFCYHYFSLLMLFQLLSRNLKVQAWSVKFSCLESAFSFFTAIVLLGRHLIQAWCVQLNHVFNWHS